MGGGGGGGGGGGLLFRGLGVNRENFILENFRPPYITYENFYFYIAQPQKSISSQNI